MTCARTHRAYDYRPARRLIATSVEGHSHRGPERERENFRNRLATIRRTIVRGFFATRIILAVSRDRSVAAKFESDVKD